jgi:hypothetical protein
VSEESPDQRERVHWAWVIGCTLAGAGILSFTVTEYPDAAPDALCEVGTGFFLAATLFFLGRRFTRQVVHAGRNAITEAAEQIEDRLQEQTDALSRRVDDLQAQVQQRMDQTAHQQDQKVAALATETSRDFVIDAMAEAIGLGAIRWGMVTVPGSTDPAGIALTFCCWMKNPGVGRSTSHWPEPVLLIDPRVSGASRGRGIPAPIRVTWKPSQELSDVAIEVTEHLQAAGLWEGPSTINWNDVRRYLHLSLELALASRRRDSTPGSWHLAAPLIELLTTDWVLTEAGVEHREHGLVLAEDNFPETPAKPWGAPRDEWPPPQPDWVEPEQWTVVLKRGESVFPIDRGPFVTAPPFIPWQPPKITVPARSGGEFN